MTGYKCEHCGEPAVPGLIVCKKCCDIFLVEQAWYAHGNSGMRFPEESDLIGGQEEVRIDKEDNSQ